MRIGPFEPREAETLEKKLEVLSIEFDIEVDEKLRDQIMKDHNDKIRLAPTLFNGSLDLRYIYFIVADEDYQQIAHELKAIGMSS